MQQILDAILSGTATAEDFAALEVPQSYRAATVHRDEVDMFEGLASQGQGPAPVAPRRGRPAARARARARHWSR